MGKSTPFEGELDRAGNPTCGQSFMAGTICTDHPDHEGFCSPTCQNCGGDWYDQTCTCSSYCEDCGTMFDAPDDNPDEPLCEDCR